VLPNVFVIDVYNKHVLPEYPLRGDIDLQPEPSLLARFVRATQHCLLSIWQCTTAIVESLEVSVVFLVFIDCVVQIAPWYRLDIPRLLLAAKAEKDIPYGTLRLLAASNGQSQD
jgi:hypothetical protein